MARKKIFNKKKKSGQSKSCSKKDSSKKILTPITKRKRGRPPKFKQDIPAIKRKRGRPPKVKTEAAITKRKRGRPPKFKGDSCRKENIKKLESDILNNSEIRKSVEIDLLIEEPKQSSRDMIGQIMFKLPYVEEPLVGTPKQVQKELDSLAKKIQRHPNDDLTFNKMHLYMHGYLIHVVLYKFPFICGLQAVDVYQETLIALRFKAIPNFKNDRGMSFLNFAKMCIRRHLITLLHASKNRKKDQSINQAISLDSSPLRDDGNTKNTYANIISDGKISVDLQIENNEAYKVTKESLLNELSEFERMVLDEYLSSSSYREISKNISKMLHGRHNAKSIDNALLRIRKKAIHLKKHGKIEDLPLFMKKE